MRRAVLDRLSSSWVTWGRLRSLARKERHSGVPTALRTKLRMWRSGFLGESYVLYDLARNSPRAYLSDYARFVQTPGINGGHASFLDDKLLFQTLVAPIARMPRCFGLIIQGRYVPLDAEPDVPLDSALEHLCRRYSALVVKPRKGGGGAGVCFLVAKPDGTFTRDGKPLERGSAPSTTDFSKRDFVVTQLVQQGEYARRIFPRTTNTLRVLTMIDPQRDTPFIAIAVHRFGTVRSGLVDNWTQGGLSALVDPDTGTLGPGISYPRGGPLERRESHPDTGERIAGLRIPGWDKVAETVLSLAKATSFMPYVGWDIVAADDGPWVIEGNSFTDVNLLQIHRPLLDDPRVRRFFEHHGVLRPQSGRRA